MTDSIDLEDGQVWGGASWLVRNIIESIAQVIGEDGNDPKLARWLIDCSQRAPGCTGFDIRGLSAERRIVFFNAAESAFERQLEMGAKEWNSPELFNGYIERFELLIQRSRTPEYQGTTVWDGVEIDLNNLWHTET